MERTPVYFQPKRKPGSADLYRNYQCPHYDLCLLEAARRDLQMDCNACIFKNDFLDGYALAVKVWEP